ncbi:hypothetical protein ACIF82_17835, partial [Streptomyces werraensis]
MSFTTPPRPVDVTALFPQLAPLARTATRLHPRPGSPTVHDSSVGGARGGPPPPPGAPDRDDTVTTADLLEGARR